MRKFDVVSICNALMDVLVQVRDEDIKSLELTKGIMHLVDSARQKNLLTYFQNAQRTIELGGSSLNAIRTLAALGAKTVFAGMVGDDEFGRQIQSRMKELGIAARLKVTAEATGTCAILITPDGERTMNTNLGASRLFDDSLVPMGDIESARIFHFSGYQWDTDGQMQAIRQAISHARKSETLVSFDVADPFVVKRHAAEFRDMIVDGADIVFANEEESKLLYNSAPEEAAHKIAATGAVAVIKLGAKGAYIASKKERVHIKPIPTKVVDTTAAGDMFAAGFLFGFHRGRPLNECGLAAATLASDVISRVGATVSPDALKRVKSL